MFQVLTNVKQTYAKSTRGMSCIATDAKNMGLRYGIVRYIYVQRKIVAIVGHFLGIVVKINTECTIVCFKTNQTSICRWRICLK